MGTLQNVLRKHKVWFGKYCTFSYPLASCGYTGPDLTKLFSSCYTLGAALSCSKPCFLSRKVQSVQQDWGHLPSLLSENIAWIWRKISTVVETRGRLCCWDYRPCFRVQPHHACTQSFKPPLFSQSVTVQLDVAENIILLSATLLTHFFKRTASARPPPASPKPIEFALAMLHTHSVQYPCSGTLLHILMLINLAWLEWTYILWTDEFIF